MQEQMPFFGSCVYLLGQTLFSSLLAVGISRECQASRMAFLEGQFMWLEFSNIVSVVTNKFYLNIKDTILFPEGWAGAQINFMT